MHQVVTGVAQPGVEKNLVFTGEGMLSVGKTKLRELQQSDATLVGAKQCAVGDEAIQEQRVCFFEKDGLLMRKWAPSTK